MCNLEPQIVDQALVDAYNILGKEVVGSRWSQKRYGICTKRKPFSPPLLIVWELVFKLISMIFRLSTGARTIYTRRVAVEMI